MAVQPNDILRVTFLGAYDDQDDIQNVFTMQYQGIAAAAEADVLTDLIAVLEALYTILAPIIAALTAFDGIRVINQSQNSDVGTGPFVTLSSGSAGSDSSPLQVCYGVTLRTVDLSVRGRKFFGPPAEGLLGLAGVLAGGTTVPLANAIVHLITQQTAPSTRPYRYGVIRGVDGVFLPFTSGSVSGNVVTQRRRRQGVGT